MSIEPNVVCRKNNAMKKEYYNSTLKIFRDLSSVCNNFHEVQSAMERLKE